MGPKFRKQTILLKTKAAVIAACAASASVSAIEEGPQVKACVSGLNGGGRKLYEASTAKTSPGCNFGGKSRMVIIPGQ